MFEFLKDFTFQKRLLWWNGALPLFLLFYDWSQDNLGANPPEVVIRTTGVLAILFVALTLLVSPLVHILKWPWAIKHRRWLGLGAFYYAFLHLLSYSFFDKEFIFSDIFQDIQKRPFILLGFASFLMMLPLAITSNNDLIKKLGAKKWKALHRLTYLIAILSSLHFWLIVKSDYLYPALFVFIFLILLGYRLFKTIQSSQVRD